MLGTRDPQLRIFSARLLLSREACEPEIRFYRVMAEHGHSIFRDEDFAGAYCCDNGRPSVPPSILATARVLQHYVGISDAEVVERCRYDIRWKVALGLDLLSTQASFAKSTFQTFRARLALHEKEGLAFERSLKSARVAGLLPEQLKVALDSSPVRGRGAVRDTFNLLSDAIVAVVRAVAKKTGRLAGEVATEAGVSRHVEAASIKGSETVDWNDQKAVSGFLGGLLTDCERTVQLAEENRCAVEEVALLKRVVAQDVEEDATSGEPAIRQGVAPDRLVSVQDPDMRHGRKSTGKVYNGHKAHVAVEVTTGLITAIQMTAPAEADGRQVANLIEQTESVTGAQVECAIGDSAYSSREAVRQAEEVGVELVARMPAAKGPGFGPERFEVDSDGRAAVCPAGIPSEKLHRARGGLVHVWPEARCESCELRGACTRGKARTLFVAVDFHRRRARERWARSPAGRDFLRLRMAVEHALGRLKNRGARQARYFGRLKTKAQWLWTAAVVNLCLLCTYHAFRTR